MTIKLSPQGQAEEELKKLVNDLPLDIDTKMKLVAAAVDIVTKTVKREMFVIEAHPDCGADNPEGKVKLCKCSCHKGHYRHYWVPVIKTPVPAADGTLYLLDRCKYCADMRYKVIKPAWVGETHKLVTMEYLIRGELRVLTKEEWSEKTPTKMDGEFKRQVNL